MADSVLPCADLLQPDAQHRQSPLTDLHVVQRRERTDRRSISGQQYLLVIVLGLIFQSHAKVSVIATDKITICRVIVQNGHHLSNALLVFFLQKQQKGF